MGKRDPGSPPTSPSTFWLPQGEEAPATTMNGAKGYGLKPQDPWVKVSPALKVVGLEFLSEKCRNNYWGIFTPEVSKVRDGKRKGKDREGEDEKQEEGSKQEDGPNAQVLQSKDNPFGAEQSCCSH